MATEREIDITDPRPASAVQFDESGNFLMYPTMLGIKVPATLTLANPPTFVIAGWLVAAVPA